MSPDRLSHLSDDVLVARFQEGHEDALETLFKRYSAYARAKGRGYFLIGADSEDIRQEALIGLYKAIRDFRPEREASFRSFAELCITRQIITAIKSATRMKHQPLNQYLSFSAPGPTAEDSGQSFEHLLKDNSYLGPEDHLILQETASEVRFAIGQILSSMEADVLELYVDGLSFEEIAARLSRHVKAVDNAVYRIKRKIHVYLRQSPENALSRAG
jgi:RNA polymerase sporulation-specific sigma factor